MLFCRMQQKPENEYYFMTFFGIELRMHRHIHAHVH